MLDDELENKYSRKADWKRLGKLVLAIVVFLFLFSVLWSWFRDQDEQEKNADITDEEIEVLHELNQE